MEAKDTVIKLNHGGILSDVEVDSYNNGAEAQAEVSFKTGMKQGIWLFAWWKDGVQYVGTSGMTLGEAYRELGIE